MTDAPTPFSITEPLPPGVLVLEASAGTGKTWTIAGLVARLVALGEADLSELLVVTFTKAATAELRDRVRQRLVDAGDHLARVSAGAAPTHRDEVLEDLAVGGADELHRRRGRLRDAVAEFDAATIATIHGFCHHMLERVGLFGDVARDAELVEDIRAQVEAVVDDVYLRRFYAGGHDYDLSREDLGLIAHAVVSNPDALVYPNRPEPDTEPELRVQLVREICRRLDENKRSGRVLSYDDLLTRLRETLLDPDLGAGARAAIRSRYRLALVDEFQDTDPTQWDILQAAFTGGTDDRLVLIGDPKQAIYRFRGADVHAYLQAARASSHRRTLQRNWRSDAELIQAFNVLFEGARFGHREIAYRTVSAAHEGERFRGPWAPLTVRSLPHDDDLVTLSRSGITKPNAAEAIVRDVVRSVAESLTAGTEVEDEDAETGWRPLEPRDIAVLVRTNRQGRHVQEALRDHGLRAVVNGVGSVFESEAAASWQGLLEALEQPSSRSLARRVAVTHFVGWDASRIDRATDDDWDDLHRRLHRWSEILRHQDVAALQRAVAVDQRLHANLLARTDGERLLTDLQHIGELLHGAATAEGLGPTALTGWLAARIAEAEQDAADERTRRLESDDEAIQILTVHRSKGLEFPIVLCPFLWWWQQPRGDEPKVPVFHADDGRRCVHVGGPSGDRFWRAQKRHRDEEMGDELRLLYVALTRARHRAMIWWAPATSAETSPLAHILFSRDEHGVLDTSLSPDVPRDDGAVLTRLREVLRAAGDTISIEPMTAGDAPGGGQAPPGGEDLDVAAFDRRLDHRWQRASYTGLTTSSRPADRVGSAPREELKDDEDLEATTPPDGGEHEHLREVELPLATLPGGREVGSLVHGVLEDADLDAADLDAELTDHVVRQQRRRRIDVGSIPDLVTGLRRVVETPLGPLTGDATLRDLPARVAEMSFELPLAGGEHPVGPGLAVADLADTLRSHLDGDPMAAYAARLDDPSLHRTVRGFLTGSIDLVTSVDLDGDQRFLLADYKTNWLAPPDEDVRAFHYRPEALRDAMLRGHYPLQALLYNVALHRYLRWRFAGYDPDRNLGGILYLFVRGMTGADVPLVDGHPCGVFAWRPPTRLVTDLSDLLDRGRVAA